MSPPISDAAQRLAAIDPTDSFIVQAPAGSGKTELLIQRFLALLGKVNRPEEILAITFTRKAAGEMRARLLHALEQAQAARPEAAHAAQTWDLASRALARDRQQGWNLLDNPALLAIQTIDSFDAGLVRRMPWISRFGGPTAIAEDPELLYRQAAEGLLSRLGSNNPGAAEIALLLEHLDNRLDLLRNLLMSLLARRDQWLRHVIWNDPEAERLALQGALRYLVEAQLARLFESVPAELRPQLISHGRFAANNLAEDQQRPLRRLREAQAFPNPVADDLPLWLGLADLLLTAAGSWRKKLDKNCGFPADKEGEAPARKQAMSALLDTLQHYPAAETLLAAVRALPEAVYPEEQWRILRALVGLLPLAVAELWLVFREQGSADFAEIALKALEALGSEQQPSELLLKLDARINHILVDEFQDTSYLQNGLLEKLTAGWIRGDGRTLFVVGDPMQSIYRFREAEVGLFLRARSGGIAGLPLTPLTLSANFRSQQGIVDWVNRAFSVVFPSREDASRGAVCYAPAAAVKPALVGAAVSLHPLAERDDGVEAALVLDVIQQARTASPHQSIAILVRSRGHLSQILQALRGAGLRYRAQDIDPLEARPVVMDLLALTRALLHPADRLAWLTVLRAPWCGLTLKDLHALCALEPLRNLPELLDDPLVLARLSEDGRQRATRVGDVLRRGLERRGRLSLRRLVEGCWLALGAPAALDAVAVEDANRLFEQLDQLDHGGDLQSLDGLQQGLRQLFAAPDAEADGLLQVMTIHKSKGLEFDTVILPGLGRRSRQGDQSLLRWLEHPDCGLLLAPIAQRDGQSRDPIYDFLGRCLKDKEDLEVCRLLYVAATRARQRLHLLGHATRKQDGSFTPAGGSLLATLWPALAEEFTARVQTTAGAAQVSAERPAVALRRLAAGWSLPEFTGVPLPRAKELTQASAQLQIEQRAAVFSGWEADTARHVGTVTHGLLERIARQGLDPWPLSRLEQESAGIRRRLGALGVPASELESACGKILAALRTTLSNQRGRWLLGFHPEAACELPLSGVVDGSLLQAVVDRTFIDDQNQRWIVDYKTSRPSAGQSLAAFLQEEGEKYHPQMLAYQGLFRQLEPLQPLRLGLYFPVVDGWIELS